MTSEEISNPASFLPYPVSTLSPPIIPNDLTSFKSRGLSMVEKELQQKLTELREAYMEAVDQFNWNKLVYEAEIRFEPMIGNVYHLYDMQGRKTLSMISPLQWAQRHLGSFRLNVGRQWELVTVGPGVEPRKLFGLGGE